MSIGNWWRYQRSYSLGERWLRIKERAAQIVAWHLLPSGVREWVVIRAHAVACGGDRHPDTVTAFDLYDAARKR